MVKIDLSPEDLKNLKAIIDDSVEERQTIKAIEVVDSQPDKTVDLDKPKTEKAKLYSPWTEIFCYIFDSESTVYDLIQTTPNRDNYIVCDGITYAIDRKMVMGRMSGYDPKMDMLSGFRKFTRWVGRKYIGVLMFEKPSSSIIGEYLKKNEDGTPVNIVQPSYREIVEPITQVTKTVHSDKKDYDVKLELVACKPILLKTIALTPVFQNMIRSFKALEGKRIMGKWWKWVLIGGAVIAVIMIIVYLSSSGMLNNIGV